VKIAFCREKATTKMASIVLLLTKTELGQFNLVENVILKTSFAWKIWLRNAV